MFPVPQPSRLPVQPLEPLGHAAYTTVSPVPARVIPGNSLSFFFEAYRQINYIEKVI